MAPSDYADLGKVDRIARQVILRSREQKDVEALAVFAIIFDPSFPTEHCVSDKRTFDKFAGAIQKLYLEHCTDHVEQLRIMGLCRFQEILRRRMSE